MSNIVWIILGTQICFTAGDLLARAQLAKSGFQLNAFLSWWFFGYVLLRTVATIGQLYVLSNAKIGQTMALFGAISIVIANVAGYLVLRETLSPVAYLGVALALSAFIVLSLR